MEREGRAEERGVGAAGGLPLRVARPEERSGAEGGADAGADVRGSRRAAGAGGVLLSMSGGIHRFERSVIVPLRSGTCSQSYEEYTWAEGCGRIKASPPR